MKSHLAAIAILTGCLALPLHASITLRFQITQDVNPDGWTNCWAYPIFSLEPPDEPITHHHVRSANGAAGASFSTARNHYDWKVANAATLGGLIDLLTNSVWNLTLNSNDASQQDFTFTLSNVGLDPAGFPAPVILSPAHNATGLPANPPYEWTGPSDWERVEVSARQEDYSEWNGEWLPAAATMWTTADPRSSGPHQFEVQYAIDNSPDMSISTPVDGGANPLLGWTAEINLRTRNTHDYSVAGAGGGFGHTLKAHYPFDNSGFLGFDATANQWHILSTSQWDTPEHAFTNDAAAGAGALEFFGGTSLRPPTELLSVLAGSFTISCWIKTEQVYGNDEDDASSGAPILWADMPGSERDVIPLALTGVKGAFHTGNSSGPEDTLHTVGDLSTGNYLHVVVTRSADTGQKRVFVDGLLDNTSFGIPGPLDAPASIGDFTIGGIPGRGYEGLLDDLQFYTGILSESEVDFLFNNPGNTVPDVEGNPLGEAVDAPYLAWTTGGDADWFPQDVNISDGIDAAQSGAIGDFSESWIETTVEGPGLLSFVWKVSSEDVAGYDYLDFSVDDYSESGISGNWDWDYYEVYLDSGFHTLRWTYYKDEDFTDLEDAAWLDEVSFSPFVEDEVELELEIVREMQGTNEVYLLFPNLYNVYPSASTFHEVESPTGASSGSEMGSSSSRHYATLEDLIAECEAGDWTLYLNRDSFDERIYRFTVDIGALDTNLLGLTTITAPAHEAAGIGATPVLSWTGPAGYDNLWANVRRLPNSEGYASTNLPVTATTWPAPPALLPGTNRFFVSYTRYAFIDVNFGEPMNDNGDYLSYWSPYASLRSSARSDFLVEEGAPPEPVEILPPQFTNGQLQFSFLTQLGRQHVVESRTNLTTAPWITITNISGDGSLQPLSLPAGSTPETYYRISTQ